MALKDTLHRPNWLLIGSYSANGDTVTCRLLSIFRSTINILFDRPKIVTMHEDMIHLSKIQLDDFLAWCAPHWYIPLDITRIIFLDSCIFVGLHCHTIRWVNYKQTGVGPVTELGRGLLCFGLAYSVEVSSVIAFASTSSDEVSWVKFGEA